LEGVKYTVSSFKITFAGKGFPNPETTLVKGSQLDDVRKTIDTRCSSGTQVIISDIIALDAAKAEQKMNNTLAFYLK